MAVRAKLVPISGCAGILGPGCLPRQATLGRGTGPVRFVNIQVVKSQRSKLASRRLPRTSPCPLGGLPAHTPFPWVAIRDRNQPPFLRHPWPCSARSLQVRSLLGSAAPRTKRSKNTRSAAAKLDPASGGPIAGLPGPSDRFDGSAVTPSPPRLGPETFDVTRPLCYSRVTPRGVPGPRLAEAT
jgi:hypothetical protein